MVLTVHHPTNVITHLPNSILLLVVFYYIYKGVARAFTLCKHKSVVFIPHPIF